jgi:hypothetical protein
MLNYVSDSTINLKSHEFALASISSEFPWK